MPRWSSLLLILIAHPVWAQTTLTLSDTVIAPKTQIGIGINGGGSWYNFVGANMTDDPSFEGPEDGGFAHAGWPWGPSGDLTGSVDTTDFVSGAQSQRIVVGTAPAHIGQGRVTLPQLPLVLEALTSQTFRIKAMVKSDTAGARIRFGAMDDGWQCRFGADIPVTTSWAEYSYDYTPATQHLLRGFCIGFNDAATFWVDDMLAWNLDDIDPATGLSATFVNRLKELAPVSLRLGGLGVNDIPLESYLRNWWDLSYGPPALGPDFDLNTFLRLCREVGAIPFICVPPAFSDDTSWQIGDLTDDVIANVYVDHGNLIDYIGGDAGTTYGARREADGYARWDTQFSAIYFELGNELWGTPDNHWDMDPNNNETQAEQMQNYATYCERRMTEMRARPGWRSNMKVGFGGRSPTTWMGGWTGSYDGTLVPAIGSLTDFSTIDMYYGDGVAGTDPDAQIFAALFANAVKHEREITDMKAAFAAANGGTDIETTVYEGNATWGDGSYQSDLSNPTPQYFKSVSLGAAVSLIDVYAASNRAGLTVNNHFHYGGNIWGATGPYPATVRKPAFHALKMFTHHIQGDMVTCTVTGSGTWNDALTGETNVPYVACYPYKQGELWHVLVVNRHITETRAIEIPHLLAPVSRISLTGPDLNANNETAENVVLVTDTLSGVLANPVTETLPPASAVVLVLSETGDPRPDGGPPDQDGAAPGDPAPPGDPALPGDPGAPGDAAAVGDAATVGDSATPGGDGTTSATGPGAITGGCSCAGGGASVAALAALALARSTRRRQRERT